MRMLAASDFHLVARRDGEAERCLPLLELRRRVGQLTHRDAHSRQVLKRLVAQRLAVKEQRVLGDEPLVRGARLRSAEMPSTIFLLHVVSFSSYAAWWLARMSFIPLRDARERLARRLRPLGRLDLELGQQLVQLLGALPPLLERLVQRGRPPGRERSSTKPATPSGFRRSCSSAERTSSRMASLVWSARRGMSARSAERQWRGDGMKRALESARVGREDAHAHGRGHRVKEVDLR